MNQVMYILFGAGAIAIGNHYGTDIFQKVQQWSSTNSNRPVQVAAVQPAAPPINAVSEERVMRSIHVITERNEASMTRKAIGLTSGALFVYLAYAYFSNSANTKKVIDKVEDTAHETQDLVKECDDNNQKRFEEMDERAEERTNNLSVEIRGEQRAHFEVLSKQLNNITNICLQTITALAGVNSSEDGEIAQPNERLKAYAKSAKEESGQLFERDSYLKAVDIHMEECRAQIAGRKPNKMKGSTNTQSNEMIFAESLTPGGPDNVGDGENNKTFKRKVSATDAQESKTVGKPKSIMELQFVKNMKLGHATEYFAVKYVDPIYGFTRQHEFAIGTFTIAAFCLVSGQYFFKRNEKKTYVE